jgi:SAM-dependent methyltransferase
LNCDPLARWYRWLEYAGFGRALERRRLAFLPEMTSARRVLILGEGDGRFLAALLRVNPDVTTDVIDSSARMIALARSRIGVSDGARVRFHCADARTHPLPPAAYDLIVTHFFLDCFEETELVSIIERLAAAATPDAHWAVSDFRQPARGSSAWAAAALLKTMYVFFRWTTGLRTQRLADPRPHLQAHGFRREREEIAHAGLLVSEWRRREPPGGCSCPSNEQEKNPGRKQHGVGQHPQGAR